MLNRSRPVNKEEEKKKAREGKLLPCNVLPSAYSVAKTEQCTTARVMVYNCRRHSQASLSTTQKFQANLESH